MQAVPSQERWRALQSPLADRTQGRYASLPQRKILGRSLAGLTETHYFRHTRDRRGFSSILVAEE